MINNFDSQIVNEIPIITQAHINQKYVTRYFVSKSNQLRTVVYEVGVRQYDDLMTNCCVIGGFLNWIIKGPLDDYTVKVYTGVPWNEGVEDINIPGVMSQNKGAVMYLGKKIPILKNTLTIYDQFYIGD